VRFDRIDRKGLRRRRVSAGSMTSDAAHPYPRWLATLAWALMAASIAVLIGGGFRVAVIAGCTTALIDRVGRLLNRRAGCRSSSAGLVAGVVIALGIAVRLGLPTTPLAASASTRSAPRRSPPC
jgi:uncharacterized membrane protein YjjP (DUF1212 family)